MTRFIRIALAGIFFIALSIQAFSQGFLHANGKAIVNGNGDTVVLRGMGLGGWMLQEGYMLQTSAFAGAQHQIRQKIEDLIGPADTELFYEAWRTNHMQKVDVDSLKSWGFNAVRLPMHYNLFTLPIEDEPIAGQNTWLDKGFELTDSLLAWCAENEIYVILDLHAAPGGQGHEQSISDYDPSKPSLWESLANRKKTIALWKRLAEHYANEPWIGGYDLINEPNWDISGNALLRSLYKEITDSIRTVDTNHLLFIEGNWFANDFNGLTPPWDGNMAYSPHKYWNFNDQASIQWVLNIRDTYNVPIFFGEAGENSNTWFRDAIKLLEANQIGWAWWPLKKIESIAGPLYIKKTPQYQALLNYWEGTGSQPSAAYAKAALMEMADRFKMENCTFQRDVIDAMFRQVYSDEAIPYKVHSIPGVIHPSDFDLGIVGSAYSDSDLANYQVATGGYTSWNNGWAYRNDGVDIQETNDNVNTNGYHIGWIAAGEWMQYSVEVTESALYDIHVRVAGGEAGGKFHFSAGEADISGPVTAPYTGGWQTWQTVVVPNVVMDMADEKVRFYTDIAGFNLGGIEFKKVGTTTSLSTGFLSAITLDPNHVNLSLNKPLAAPIPASPANFVIYVNGNPVPITDAVLNPGNTRLITFTVDHSFKSSETIRISYTGNQIHAKDGTILSTFTLKPVQNTIAIVHPVPGKIEAEDYFFQSGVQLENTTDVGGGQNIGYLDTGDYLDYYIDVAQDGFYKVFYRTASDGSTGGLQLQLIDANGGSTLLNSATFPPTGGWQVWTTTSKFVDLDKGLHHLRIVITQPQFNLNWIEFTLYSSTNEPDQGSNFKLYPNPGDGTFFLDGSFQKRQDVELIVQDWQGRKLFTERREKIDELKETILLCDYPDGAYLLTIRLENGAILTRKLVKIAP